MRTILRKRLVGRRRQKIAQQRQEQLNAYQNDPLGYIRDILGQKVWSKQEEIVNGLMRPPYKVEAKSCNKVGKSWLAAALISWHFDCFEKSLTISTAQTKEGVQDQLWREVRIQRQEAGLGGFKGPAAPELYSSDWHWAKGFTTARSESFRGRHQQHMLFIVDEACGVKPWVFDDIRSMFKPTGLHHWLIVGNPTNTASMMYAEELRGDWTVVTLSALDHPNLAPENIHLPTDELPFPAAVDAGQFQTWLLDWCDVAKAEDAADDPSMHVHWPPGSGQWWRVGPEFEARGLGRWPSSGTYGVWSDSAWLAALTGDNLPDEPSRGELPVLGCDPARYGDDYTAIHVRCGGISYHHERHNGWDGPRVVGRLKELCREWAGWATARREPTAAPIRPEDIRVNIDSDGMGGMGAVDWGGGYHFVGIGAATAASDPSRYPNKRSELWFSLALRAKRGMLDLSKLDAKTRQRLQQQCMAPVWTLDGAGRRVVESKADTKKRLKMGSPDDADACMLAYYDGGFDAPEVVVVDAPGSMQPHANARHRQKGWFGRQ